MLLYNIKIKSLLLLFLNLISSNSCTLYQNIVSFVVFFFIKLSILFLKYSLLYINNVRASLKFYLLELKIQKIINNNNNNIMTA